MRVALTPNMTSVLLVYLDKADQIEFRKSQRLYTIVNDDLICALTCVPYTSIYEARARLVELGVLRKEKRFAGKEGFSVHEIMWRVQLAPEALRPTQLLPPPRDRRKLRTAERPGSAPAGPLRSP
jgi:hypothetical protein